jgi:hypothetical protein
MINTGTPRRLIRTHRGFSIKEDGKIIAKGLNFTDAFNLLRETGDFLPMCFDEMHRRQLDILEDIIGKSFGIRGWKVLGDVPYPFMK